MSTSVPVPRPTDLAVVRFTNAGVRRDLWSPNSIEYRYFQDQCGGDAVPGRVVTNTNGASAAVTATATGYSLVSGTDDNGTAQYYGPGLACTGDLGALVEAVITFPATITTMKVEVGFTDATDDAQGAVNAKATPTSTATDHASLVFDTDDDGEWAFQTNMSGGSVQATDLTKFTPAGSTTYRIGVRVDGNSASAYINGEQVGGHGDALEGGNAIAPYVLVVARAGSASRTLTLANFRSIAPAY